MGVTDADFVDLTAPVLHPAENLSGDPASFPGDEPEGWVGGVAEKVPPIIVFCPDLARPP